MNEFCYWVKRSLFRLWLNLPDPRKLPPELAQGPAREGMPRN
jgi:hypothetical protein